MTAGLQSDLFSLNDRLGRAVVALAAALDDVVALNAMLNDADRFNGAAGLQASQGYTAPDAATIMEAFGDLANLAAVAHAETTVPAANDFFFHAKLMMGTVPL
jgi:isoaspartyl peptidase/L-asparaginase-like protein (Ntn-hydrolase superfamily)